MIKRRWHALNVRCHRPARQKPVMARTELTAVEWRLIEPLLPIGRFGPYPEHLREQSEGVIWKFGSGGQWREMPPEFGVWQTVYNRFLQWRDAGVFQALIDAMIPEAARRGPVDLSLVSVDSTMARAHHDAAGLRVSEAVLSSLEDAAEASKGAAGRNESLRSQAIRRRRTRTGRNGGASGGDAGPG